MWMDETRKISERSLRFGGTTTISDVGGTPARGVHDRDVIVDRYGNPIEEAVGDYRVDPRGDIFERHSPATEIARLPDPSA